MSASPASRTEMLQSIAKLEKKFSQSLADAQALAAEFDQAQANMKAAIDKHLKKARQKISPQNPLRQEIENIISDMDAINAAWNEGVASREKGTAFRSAFQDSLLVFINGKVKSGKSSLGNYMAWGHTNPGQALIENTPAQSRPVYRSAETVKAKGGDAEKEAEKKQQFRVNDTEATSSIQSFTLPGLTWVDSPGLHSTQQENGTLAIEYRNYADLILYTMSSSASARESDLKEIAELFSKDKKAIFLITGSDTQEEDEDAQGNLVSKLVMKPMNDRQEQVKRARAEIEKMLAKQNKNVDFEVISISARFAQYNENSPTAFAESGMPEFFKILDETVHSQGIKLKQQVPLRNLKKFIADCNDAIQPYKNLTQSIDEKTRKLQTDVVKKVQRHAIAGSRELQEKLTHRLSKVQFSEDREQINEEIKAIQSSAQRDSKNIINAKLESILIEVMSDFEKDMLQSYEASQISNIPDFNFESVTKTIKTGLKRGSKRKWTAILTAIASVGTAIATEGASIPIQIAATTAAGTAAAAIGDKIGSDSKFETKQISIISGDNLHEIKTKTLEVFSDHVENIINQEGNRMLKNFLKDIELIAQFVEGEVSNFECSVKHISMEIQKQLH